MDKEFVPYEPSLELKELCFNEPCFMFYEQETSSKYLQKGIDDEYWGDYSEPRDWNSIPNKPWKPFCQCVSAPTFSQAFRWFREKYNLHAEPYTANMGAIEYCFQIRDLYSEKYVYDNFQGSGGSYGGTFDTTEEAELACLIKLIELVKSK